MRRIIDTFKMEDIELPIDRQLPTPEDIKAALPKHCASYAINLLGCEETIVREHLRMGSTPTTKFSIMHSRLRDRLLQSVIYRLFKENFICL